MLSHDPTMIPTPVNLRQRHLLVAALVILPLQVIAGEPADIRVGELSLTPTLRLSKAYDDNFREAAEPDNQSSWITTIAPALELAAQDRLNLYRLRYALDADIYHASHDDDNTDHHLDADAHLEFTSRHRLDLNAGYDRVENTADATSRAENDKYHTRNIGAVYGLGVESAAMQIELAADQEHRRYDNSGTLNQDKNRDTRSLSATAYYRLAPKTRALLEIGSSDFDYLSARTLDSVNRSYLAGVTLDATARTSGSFKVGREEKDFDDPAASDPGLTAWYADLTWKPRTYSSVRLTARQGIDEGSSEEQFVETRMAGLEWDHAWNGFFSTQLAVVRSKMDYANAANRHDETDTYRLGLTWEFRRWLSLDLGYRYRQRESNVDQENFERSLYLAGLNLNL
ncbi:outer membrane beta-barrel protein [Marinobacterium sedimentorum]|uniref:outer membrane beta-barrel protein n=1 Tax=Marinobacterium sedimentorum TaxID=2927804 RepID=UPI0020C71F3F|nr:outer membrane beta-barrel protein [Marinobacterium sedimentorum]MCP8690027.1 outer membrane beta-barrel protein [Marinobacterium sedimentorum]